MTTSRPRMSVAVIIPCHNEAEGMNYLRDRLATAIPVIEAAGPWAVRVLLFDNGSTDDTLARMRAVFGADPRYVIHHSPTTVGIGGSLRAGLSLISGDVIVGMDSDCTYDPEEVARLLERTAAGWDIVTGSPYHPQGGVVNVPEWRLFLSRGLSGLYRLATPVKMWTYTAMFRAYRRPALEAIRWESDGFLSTSEILVEAAAAGFTICEVPMMLHRRRFGVSKIRILRVIGDHLRYLFRVMTSRPLRRRLSTNFRPTPSAELIPSGSMIPERAFN